MNKADKCQNQLYYYAEGRGQERLAERLVQRSRDALPEGSRGCLNAPSSPRRDAATSSGHSQPPAAPPRACRPTSMGKERAESGGREGVELGRKRRMGEDEAAGSAPVVAGRWERKFAELKSFMQQSGGHDYVCKPANIALYQWIASQRFFYKDGTLSEQRIELLNAVNFSWTAADAKLKRDNMGQGEESRAQGPFEEEEGEGGKKQACRHDKAESKHVHEVEELGEERKRLKL